MADNGKKEKLTQSRGSLVAAVELASTRPEACKGLRKKEKSQI